MHATSIGLRMARSKAAPPWWVLFEASWVLDGIGRRGWRRAIGSSIGESFDEAALTDFLTLTRAGTGRYFDSAGVLQSAAADVMRFDHDPATLAPLGILSEGARTNVVLWNRDLTNAAWTKTNVTAAKNQVGIDGVSNSASSLTATANNGTCLQAITLASSARAQPVFVKRLTGSGTVEMTMNGGSTWTAITLTWSWARVTIPTATLANPSVGFRLATSGDAIAVDFVQNENGAIPSSPIATTSAAVTRVVETPTMAPGDWHNAAAGTWVVEYTIDYNSPNQYVLYADSGSSANRFYIYASNGGMTGSGAVVVSNGVSQASMDRSLVPVGTSIVSFAYAADSFGVSFNGSSAAVDLAGAVPAGLTSIQFGPDGASLFGHIRRVFYIPRRVSNAELQALTA